MARSEQTRNQQQSTQPKGTSARSWRRPTSSGSPQSKSAARPVGFRARGRKGEALTSPRDRQKLRERNLAERARVEKMLASAPAPNDPNDSVYPSHAGGSKRIEQMSFGESRLRALDSMHDGDVGCPVCGDERIVTDEVLHGGTLSMSECLHCDYRWTNRPKARWVSLGARMNGARRAGNAATA